MQAIEEQNKKTKKMEELDQLLDWFLGKYDKEMIQR